MVHNISAGPGGGMMLLVTLLSVVFQAEYPFPLVLARHRVSKKGQRPGTFQPRVFFIHAKSDGRRLRVMVPHRRLEQVVNKCLKDPVLGTKIDIETGDVIEWCPSLLGKLLSPILGPEPKNAGVNVFKVGLEKKQGAQSRFL